MGDQIDLKKSVDSSGYIAEIVNKLMIGRYRAAIGFLQLEAPDTLAQIIEDMSPELDAAMVDDIERLLGTGGAPFVRFEKTLMPLMAKRFGVELEQLKSLGKTSLKAANQRCNSCSEGARCWKALRTDESSEECREFCPNSEVFELIKKLPVR